MHYLHEFLFMDWAISRFFCLSLKPENKINPMKKLSIIALLTALMFCLASCGEKNSKQFKAMEEEILSIDDKISTIEDCDELQMLNFSILGLRSDLDNLIQSAEIPDVEINQLDEMLTSLEAEWNGKWSALECDQTLMEEPMDTSGEEEGEYQDYDIF